jgi:acetyl-CoA synthase
MNGPIEVNAERGTQRLLASAGQLLDQALAQRSPRAEIVCLNTVYYLPIALATLAQPAQRLGDLRTIFEHASNTTDKGRAALLAAEIIEALRAADGHFLSPISDVQIHSWGIQLADGRMPGIALLLGRATSPEAAWDLVEELLRHNILCLLGSGLQAQLRDGGHEPGGSNHVVSLGEHASSGVHGIGLAARCAMRLGGHKPGAATEILEYCQRCIPGFVLALGGLDERDYAIALGAEEFGFPLIETQGGVENAGELAEQCIARRGLKPNTFNIQLPVSYGPAFEEEDIPEEETHIHFGGPGCDSFLLVEINPLDSVADGKIEVVGGELPNRPQHANAELGLVVRLAGATLKSDYETYLERQVPTYINYIQGVRCTFTRSALSVRISRAAAARGLDLQSIGKVIHARFHADFDAVEKVQITLITDPARHAHWLEKSRAAHALREQRLAGITDDQVEEFYVCTNCRPIAPRNVSIISPERVSPCGKTTWLDARASYELNAGGARRPIKIGNPIDIEKGIWEGTNQYARTASQGRIEQVSLYSIMETPMAACADFECIVVLIPDVNGVMVLGREDTMMPTPAGLTVETFASLAAGEQIPGIVGMGRSHLLSRKFLAPEGGFKRVVWMSSTIKEALRDELVAVCAREGAPDLMDKIADERNATTVDELARWLRHQQHPALKMGTLF